MGMATVLPSGILAATPPSDKVNLALLGCRNMGFGVLSRALEFDDVNCVAMCDIDKNVLREKAAEVEKTFGQKPEQYTDFRKMLEQKNIDGILISTPDHWHCLNFIYALQAGKDVYVEKPMANTIGECNIMVEAARRYNKQVVQVGQQQRSGETFNEAMKWIKGGRIGKLRKVNVWANFHYGVGPQIKPDGPVPEGVDYDFWLGPAPERPFNPNRFHGFWRHFWDYGGGLLSDWSVHLLDIALWAADITTGPDRAMVYADNLFAGKHHRETFDTMNIIFPKDDFVINYDMTAGTQKGPWGESYGLAFVGDHATLVVNRGMMKVIPENGRYNGKPRAAEFEMTPRYGESHNLHVRNFMDCIKTRETPVCTPEMGRAAALHAHTANIAARVGEPMLLWDEATGRFTNSEAANELLMPEYRKPWAMPKL